MKTIILRCRNCGRIVSRANCFCDETLELVACPYCGSEVLDPNREKKNIDYTTKAPEVRIPDKYKTNDILLFDTHGGDSKYNQYTGKKVQVIRPMRDDEFDRFDVGPMYKVKLVDDSTYMFDAFEDELSYVSETTRKCMIEFNRNHFALFPNQKGMNWWWNFKYFRFNMNGSITCKASEEALNCLETQSLAVALLWENSLDTQLVGEDGCISNFDMYTPLYFPNIGLACLVPYSTSEEWKAGKEVTLSCYEPTKEEVLEFIEWWNDHE